MSKLDFIKISDFCPLKVTVKRMKKRQATDWEKIQIIYLIKNLNPEYIKNSQNLQENITLKK